MYKKFLFPGVVLAASLLMLCVPVTQADEELPKLRNSFFFVGGESFKFTESVGSTDITEDSGSRAVVGIGWSNLFIPTGGAIYRASITGYAGMPTFECTATPTFCPTSVAESESRYLGLRIEGMGGYRFGTIIGVEVFSGVGLDFWNRSVQDSTDILGGTYNGYDTYNAVSSFKLGVSLLQRFNSFGYFLRGGVKAPFLAWQRIDIADGVEVRPGVQMSFFANLDLTFGTLPRDRFVISLYYDSMNLGKSDPEVLTSNGIPVGTLGSPASKSSAMGAQLVFGF